MREVASLPGGGLVVAYDAPSGDPGLLTDLLARAPLSPQLCLTLLAQLLAGVAHAHARGVIHGALYHTGVLLCGRRPRGLRCDPSRDPRVRLEGLALGAAPSGCSEDPGADVRDTGRIAWHALTGRPPSPAPRLSDALRAALPQGAAELLDSLLAPRPPDAATAAAACRAQAIALFAQWQRRREPELLAEQLRLALEERDEIEVRRLAAAVEVLAPGEASLPLARSWLQRRQRRRRASSASFRAPAARFSPTARPEVAEVLASERRRGIAPPPQAAVRLAVTAGPTALAALLTALMTSVFLLAT
ncbi:MAG TPA: hypothetical protein VMT16_06875 [Thermoanaerobaculia bacterium]|nr:hypothetical protein [Thermoanaerobaculia bacterium]